MGQLRCQGQIVFLEIRFFFGRMRLSGAASLPWAELFPAIRIERTIRLRLKRGTIERTIRLKSKRGTIEGTIRLKSKCPKHVMLTPP